MKTQMVLLVALIIALLSFQASAGCGRWVVRDNTDFLDDPTFDEAVKSSTGDSASTNGQSPANQSTETATEKESQTKVAEKQTQVMDVSGKWLFKLQQDVGSPLNLILIQSGDRLQGYGTLAEKGSEAPATATGTISRDAVNLDVKLSKLNEIYKLDLIPINSTLEGSYELYVADKLTEKGNTTASRSGT